MMFIELDCHPSSVYAIVFYSFYLLELTVPGWHVVAGCFAGYGNSPYCTAKPCSMNTDRTACMNGGCSWAISPNPSPSPSPSPTIPPVSGLPTASSCPKTGYGLVGLQPVSGGSGNPTMFIADLGISIGGSQIQGITTDPNVAQRVTISGGNLLSTSNPQLALSALVLGPAPQQGGITGPIALMPPAPADAGPLTLPPSPSVTFSTAYESSFWSIDGGGLFTLTWSLRQYYQTPIYAYPRQGAIGPPSAMELFFSDDVHSANYASRVNLFFVCP